MGLIGKIIWWGIVLFIVLFALGTMTVSFFSGLLLLLLAILVCPLLGKLLKIKTWIKIGSILVVFILVFSLTDFGTKGLSEKEDNVEIDSIEQTKEEEIKEELSKCPQFDTLKIKYSNSRSNYIVLFNKYSAYTETSESVDGWKIEGGWNYIGDRYLICHKGNKEGQNINNYYCGDVGEGSGKIIKKVTNEDGIIKETIKKEMILVYSENEEYIETLC
jgi:energy-coupling factor transporter transmembrane protein EcfT